MSIADNWKEIEIVFTRSKKFLPFFSWGIRLWTWKPYSHVARAVEIRDWGKRFYQASEGKVNYEFEKFFYAKHHVVKKFIIKVPPEMDRQIKHECYKQAGNSYSLMQNVGIILVDIAEKLGLKLKNPWKKGVNCSEILYVNVFKQLFPDLDYDPDTIKPHHIEEILINKGYTEC